MTITIEQQRLLDEIKEGINKNGEIRFVNGAFGDMEGCTGILQDIIKPEEGGIFVKIYGCNFMTKGYPEKDIIEGFSLAKSMVSIIPKEVVAKSIPMQLALGWDLLFNRKRFIHKLHVYFGAIYSNEIQKLNIPDIRYNRVSKELKRAVYATIQVMNPDSGIHGDVLHRDFELVRKEELGELIASIVEFVCALIELDSAYRFRIQDVLMLLDKESLVKNPVKEIRRMFKIMEERERSGSNMKDKIHSIGKMIVLFLYLSPEARKWARTYLKELDLSQISFDESDHYFILQRQSYDFQGISLEERLKERERIDKEQKHIKLHISETEKGGIQISV